MIVWIFTWPLISGTFYVFSYGYGIVTPLLYDLWLSSMIASLS